MRFQPRSIETRIATVTLVRPGLIEQRYRHGERIDLPGFAENKRARLDLAGGRPCVMLSIIPRDMDFDMEVTGVDHFGPERGQDTLRALAVVVHDSMAEMVTKLFFTYFPTVFRTQVFNEEAEARRWLQQQLAEVIQEEGRWSDASPEQQLLSGVSTDGPWYGPGAFSGILALAYTPYHGHGPLRTARIPSDHL